MSAEMSLRNENLNLSIGTWPALVNVVNYDEGREPKRVTVLISALDGYEITVKDNHKDRAVISVEMTPEAAREFKKRMAALKVSAR